MKNRLIFASFLLLVGASCRHDDVEPAQSVEGTYQAKDYNHFSQFSNSYPINGQTLSLHISYVSADTVSVEITPSAATGSLPDGVYSPTQTLVYPKAYVETLPNMTTYIYLTGKPTTVGAPAENQIWIYKGNQIADYIFTPKQTPHFSTDIRFEKQ